MSNPPSKTPPKPTENKPFEKIRNLFGRGHGKTGGSSAASNLKVQPQEFTFTRELDKELSKETPTQQRLRVLKELCEIVEKRRLEPMALERVWTRVNDLCQPSCKKEERQTVLSFLVCLIHGQYEHLGMMRDVFFQFVSGHRVSEDLSYRLKIFKVLSQEGKDLKYFERETGGFLVSWMKEIMLTPHIKDFLALVVNVLKFNASFIDEEIMSEIVHNTCMVANQSGSEADIALCLRVLDTVVCYSYLPRSSLVTCVACLCLVLNVETFSLEVWNLMKKLLGTHIGHSAIYTMCALLEDRKNISDKGALLMKGAVSFLGMALWGSKQVTSLKVPASSVLPSMLQALHNGGSSVVANEIVLVLGRLVSKQGKEQQHATWDLILAIAEELVTQIESVQIAAPTLLANTHDLLTGIESVHAEGSYVGSSERLFCLIERCSSKRPEGSILSLVTYMTASCQPGQMDWMHHLNALMERYYRLEVRTKIRLKVLDVLAQVLNANQCTYEEDMLEAIVLPHLSLLDQETDTLVVTKAISILVDQAQSCQTARCTDIIQILKRILCQQPLSPPSISTEERAHYTPVDDRREAATALVNIFKMKLFQVPGAPCLDVYEILVCHLQSCYHGNHYSLQAAPVRRVIFACLLSLRADSLQRMGLHEENKTTYSPYMQLSNSLEGFGSSPLVAANGTAPVSSPCKSSTLVYAQTFRCLSQCLQKEMDWSVLGLVLECLPLLLMNKALMLSTSPDDLATVCTQLCYMVSEKLGLPEKLVNAPTQFTKSQFHSAIFPVLTCFVSYHGQLDKGRQRELIKCLEFGLVSRTSARMCVRALAVCALEIQDMMMRELPAVLLKLSQISATTTMAIPLMEFLSSLIHLPRLYCNFVEDQYMSVFAIALPYTNPFKYSHYTVSLAYHVISMWFLKCRLSFRKGFVQFIVKGLHANVLRQIEDSSRSASRYNQDSSDRFRTQSLNDESARSPDTSNSKSRAAAQAARSRVISGATSLAASSAAATSAGARVGGADDNLATFHKELTETCIDMMARYTFSTFTNLPRRSNVSEFLLNGGQTARWLLGTRIITITTSGGAKVGKAGLCEKCLRTARAMTGNDRTAQQGQGQADRSVSDQSLMSGGGGGGGGGGRRRHKSAAVPTITKSVPLKPSSQDDLIINRSPHDGSLERRLSSTLMGSRESNLTNIPSEEELTPRGALLETRSDKMQALDNVLLGLKAGPSDTSIFTPHLCNCWCTQWAEIHVRTPTGNLSWMMRIQNDQDLAAIFPDFPLEDISHLFMPGSGSGQKPQEEEWRGGRQIDSNSLGDEEYDSLHEEHFHTNNSDAFTRAMLGSDCSTPTPMDDVAQPEDSSTTEDSREGKDDTMETAEEDVNSKHSQMRKTASSPDLSPLDPALPPLTLSDALSSSSEAIRASSSTTVMSSTSSSLLQDSRSADQLTMLGATSTEDMLRRPRGHTISSIPEESQIRAAPTGSLTNVLPSSSSSTSSIPTTHSKFSSKLSDSFGKGGGSSSMEPIMHGGVNPSFLFLQLYHQQHFGKDAPVPLPETDVVKRAINMFDLIFPYETHKIGVLYVGPGQATDQSAILSNTFGSVRYTDFVAGLGHLLRLGDCDRDTVYVGGLDTEQKAEDGHFAYAWHDEFMQVIFHVATLMPTREKDPQCNAKKRHIGNDYITIVYNDSGVDYNLGTIKGQFNYVSIVVVPLDNKSNAVTVQTKDEIEDLIGHTDLKIISDAHLPVLVRQMAMHADLASTIIQKQKANPNDLYASNWLERLRAIKRLRTKVDTNQAQKTHNANNAIAEDFTEYL